MPRFITNRWWTFILALILGVGAMAALPYHASADGVTGSISTDDGGSGGASVPPPGNGDPDIPIGSVKKSQWGAMSQPLSGSYQVQTVGDGPSWDRAVMWRLRIAMRILRALYLRG